MTTTRGWNNWGNDDFAQGRIWTYMLLVEPACQLLFFYLLDLDGLDDCSFLVSYIFILGLVEEIP